MHNVHECAMCVDEILSMAHVGTQFGGVHIYIYICIHTHIYIWFCGYTAHKQKARCQTAGYRHFQCF